MKLALAALLGSLWLAAGIAPEPTHFRFERGVTTPAAGRACLLLDGDLYAHARPGLADVRLFAGGVELPYALTMSQSEAGDSSARVLNRGERNGHIVFDVEMPHRAYSAVTLKLAGQDFVGSATVSGLPSSGTMQCCSMATRLGTFAAFDLTGEHLGRNTTLPLTESTFAYLHVELEAKALAGHAGFVATPAMVEGATVPPSREAQTLYTTVAETASVERRGSFTIAHFTIPAHVPVERVSFALDPQDRTNFSRAVTITARANLPSGSRIKAESEVENGTIARVRMTEQRREIREQRLDVDATLGSQSQYPAQVEVAIDNGNDPPLAIAAVNLQMRERKLCFDAPAQTVTMYYGDYALASPNYDYSRLFQAGGTSGVATLGAEFANPAFAARVAPMRGFRQRHPELQWVALLMAVGSLVAAGAMRPVKRR